MAASVIKSRKRTYDRTDANFDDGIFYAIFFPYIIRIGLDWICMIDPSIVTSKYVIISCTCVLGQHTAKRRRKCTKQSRSCL